MHAMHTALCTCAHTTLYVPVCESVFPAQSSQPSHCWANTAVTLHSMLPKETALHIGYGKYLVLWANPDQSQCSSMHVGITPFRGRGGIGPSRASHNPPPTGIDYRCDETKRLILAAGLGRPKREETKPRSRDTHRGTVTPFVFYAGGEAIEAVSTAATKAAEEAATGSWLTDLESGKLPRIAAPGLGESWFGAWQGAPPDPTPSGRSLQAMQCC